MDDLPDSLRAFLRLPNPAVMATLARDGRPVSVATWYLLEPSGQVLLNLDGGRARLAHLRRDPRVSLTVLDRDDWYSHVSLRLEVTAIEDDGDLSGIDALSRHYTAGPYPDRGRPRVNARADVLGRHAWGTRFESIRD